MDQAMALLAALRAAASLGDGRLNPARVEALAGTLGIKEESLPALAARLQEAKQVELQWGGVLKVLPEASAGAGVVQNFQGASFGPGAVVAGRDATGGTVTVTPEAAFGALAAVIAKLQEVRPGLQGEAAEAADGATQALKAPPAAEASADTRRAWASKASGWLGRLLATAPQAKAAAELGEEIVKGLGWS
jgi:hypothetical protein